MYDRVIKNYSLAITISMKQAIIVLLVAVVIAGVTYWFYTQDNMENSISDTPSATEQESVPAATDYVGLTEAEAEALATQNDVPFRVVERDGEMLPTTRDFREGRINAVVENGVVSSYTEELDSPPAAEPEEAGESDTSGDTNETDTSSDANDIDTPGNEMSNVDLEDGAHDAIIGMTRAEAEAYADANNVPFRIGSVDGEARPVTMDYRPGRITASIKGGIVTSYTVE